MQDYEVKKITMDTYRYNLFKMAFEAVGLTVEDKKNKDKVVSTVEDAIQGALDIIAEDISDNAKYRKEIKRICYREGIINTKASYEDEKSAYEMYYDFNNTSVTEDKYGNKTFGKIEPKLRKNDGFMAFDVAMFSKDEIEMQVIYI